MASVEVKKRGGRAVGIILMVVGLFLAVTTVILQKQRTQAINNSQVSSANNPLDFKWVPIVGVAVLGVGAILTWKSSKPFNN